LKLSPSIRPFSRSEGKPVVHHALRGKSIGGIESTLACPGTKLEHTDFFSVRARSFGQRSGSEGKPVVHHALRGESIGGIESTLACPGTKLEHTAFFSFRRNARRSPRFERRVDWRHREHSSLSRNEVRAYSLFLGQKESPSFTTL
jgi:hypothetical protein